MVKPSALSLRTCSLNSRRTDQPSLGRQIGGAGGGVLIDRAQDGGGPGAAAVETLEFSPQVGELRGVELGMLRQVIARIDCFDAAQLDPIQLAIGRACEVVEQLGNRSITGEPRVSFWDVLFSDKADVPHLDQADRRAVVPSADHLWALPTSEGEADRAVEKTFLETRLEQHVATVLSLPRCLLSCETVYGAAAQDTGRTHA